MSNSLRPFESYLDEVANEKGFSDFEIIGGTEMRFRVMNEANNRMCEDAFKAQKEICAERAEVDTVCEYDEGTEMDIYKVVVKKSSIINCPTPFNNQNKN